jgi:acyl-CoA synthetase (AMP-forming)/AMP-acid ligase II
MNKYENELSVEEILQMSRPDARKIQLPVSTDLDTTITYVMTSGSTGRPKAVRRTNRNHLSTVAMFAHKELCPLTADDVLLNCGFCHICGQRSLLSVIDAGAALLVLACDETHDEVFEAINKFGATAALLVPTQLNYLVKNPQKYHKNYFRTLQNVLTGAAPLSRSTYETIRERFRFRNFRNSLCPHVF